MLATISSATVLGARGLPVRVEVHIGTGLPGFTIVGQADGPCREGRDRIKAAFTCLHLPFTGKKVTVNLAPSGVRKAGTSLDLALAVGVLVANGTVAVEAVEGHAFVGELGLDGSLCPVPGLVPIVGALDAATVVVPAAAHHEAALVAGSRVRGVGRLDELVAVLRQEIPWPDPPPAPPTEPDPPGPDLSDVRGQAVARQALAIAAAGAHHLLLVGPPGAGKTMLARRLPGLLPPLDASAALEATAVHSAAGVGLPPGGLVRRPPFRAPHHSSSTVSVIGGGSHTLRPGEISLATHGVLFLDEMGEFPPSVLESLRTPLEEGVVRVSRARQVVELPARFVLVGAMNPCPCGEGGAPGACRCSPGARARYQRRLSGPLLDRFDLRVEVDRPGPAELLGGTPGTSTAAVAAEVAAARARAAERGVPANAVLDAAGLERWAALSEGAAGVMEGALRAGALSARGLARVRAVARTIADLEGDTGRLLRSDHVALALALRRPVTTVDQRLAG